MVWHNFERACKSFLNQATLFGRAVAVFILMRIVVVWTVVRYVYSDEQGAYSCNTLQVGCKQVCFNSFSPISIARFWLLQILFVCQPIFIFMVYMLYATKEIRTAPNKNGKSRILTNDELRKKILTKIYSKQPRKRLKFGKNFMDVLKRYQFELTRKIMLRIQSAYLCQMLAIVAVDCAFLTLHYFFIAIWVYDLYKCNRWPCPNNVDCFASRSNEKNVCTITMTSLTVITIIFGVCEVLHIIIKLCSYRGGGNDPQIQYLAEEGIVNFENESSTRRLYDIRKFLGEKGSDSDSDDDGGSSGSGSLDSYLLEEEEMEEAEEMDGFDDSD